ncbi:MAG: type I-U CRISPR-associated helicase/endonuclease Cas3 [Planctomycetes bacterium]|nr:type I-U CRISPR-associated helicase/endonuclease Cas3 [Planctomycetota bacterium]
MPKDKLDLETAFTALTGTPPFPWQQALYERFIADRSDNVPESCNLPTGLGKTSVLAIWLIALATHPEKMPRRLVYVVNRRTVVDQTTTEAEKLKGNAKIAGVPEPAISTLRGQFADNREWSADPSRPAIICGTVDMIGSRLLFSGYGVGFKGKPLHAGFLGQDVLLVHDEAHLEPAFQDLIKAIEAEQKRCNEFGQFRVMELTATSREGANVFKLTPEEAEVPDNPPADGPEPLRTVWKRLKSRKALKFWPEKRDSLAKRIGEIARDKWKNSKRAILIFVRTIADVKAVYDTLTDKKQGVNTDQVQVLTGVQRGLERDRMANPKLTTGCPIFARFLSRPKPDAPDSEQWKTIPKEGTVYLVCTSAGEVGVNISADHMVCDLATLDSMAQRLGRVNRRGEGEAVIDVVYESDPNPKPASPEFEAARWETKKILDGLPTSTWDPEVGRKEASPLTLRRLPVTDDQRRAAFAPPPTILPTTDILFDAWALTTIREPLPGRPPVEPYLHGLPTDWQPPETYVAWRQEVWELRLLDREDRKELAKFAAELLENFPLKPHELLRDTSARVLERLKNLKASPETPVWLVSDGGDVEIATLGEIAAGKKEDLYFKTVLLPPEAGGLSPQGMLDPASTSAADVSEEWFEDKDRMIRLRARVWDDAEPPPGMRRCRPPIDTRPDADESEESPAKRFWHWYERPDKAGEGKATAHRKYELRAHLDDARAVTDAMVARLNLSEPLRSAIVVAAMYHDLGKNRAVWQRSIGNVNVSVPLAKSGGRMEFRELNGYRHELGSIVDVGECEQFKRLDADMQQLVLHLIAAHHGRARPHFPADEAFDLEPRGRDVETLASEIPRRFARLQRKYGRWGLAYLESLVRAADISASQKAEKGGEL